MLIPRDVGWNHTDSTKHRVDSVKLEFIQIGFKWNLVESSGITSVARFVLCRFA